METLPAVQSHVYAMETSIVIQTVQNYLQSGDKSLSDTKYVHKRFAALVTKFFCNGYAWQQFEAVLIYASTMEDIYFVSNEKELMNAYTDLLLNSCKKLVKIKEQTK